MNEFQSMLKEAFFGEEPYDPRPGRADLEASLRRFESRDRTLRLMLWFAVSCMSAVAVVSAWKFFAVDNADGTQTLILCATLFLWAIMGVGWSKMFLFLTQQQYSIQKELKRLHLALLEQK